MDTHRDTPLKSFKVKSMCFHLSSLFVTSLFLLSACTPPPENETENISSLEHQEKNVHSEALNMLTLGDCNKEDYPSVLVRALECGKLLVPENPDMVDGRNISLNIARLPAISSRPEPDPLFIFAGGPGQAATELVPEVLTFARKVNQQRDIIFVDQRGTGKSNPLDCDSEEDPDYSLSYEESGRLQLEKLKECLNNYDADLTYYTTPYAMDDINAVRKALSYEKINVWGASYGTRAALVYMRRHPDTVRTAILDSVAPLDMNIPSHFLEDADSSLRRLFKNCDNNTQCREEFGDLEATTKQLIKKLNDSPKHISIKHPATQKDIDVVLSGQVLASYLRLALYSREMSSVLPLMIQSINDDDFRILSVLFSSSENSLGGMSVGMQYTVLCAEDVLSGNASGAEGAVSNVNDLSKSVLQLNLVKPMKSICQFWPPGKLPDTYNIPTESDIPTLILSGELDPVTPPYWGDKAAEALSNSEHIVVPGTHHGSSFAGCVPDIIDEFMTKASFESIDSSCVKKIKPLYPFVSAAGPAMKINAIDNNKKNDKESSND